MSPFEGLDTPISLQAWGYQLKVDNADDSRIDEFIKALRVNASIEGPSALRQRHHRHRHDAARLMPAGHASRGRPMTDRDEAATPAERHRPVRQRPRQRRWFALPAGWPSPWWSVCCSGTRAACSRPTLTGRATTRPRPASPGT